MKEYEIYLPLTLNNGDSVPVEIVNSTKSKLIDFFGGLTDMRHRNEGIWKIGAVTYRDEILILRVLAAKSESEVFLKNLKEELKAKLAQNEILIVEKDVRIV